MNHSKIIKSHLIKKVFHYGFFSVFPACGKSFLFTFGSPFSVYGVDTIAERHVVLVDDAGGGDAGVDGRGGGRRKRPVGPGGAEPGPNTANPRAGDGPGAPGSHGRDHGAPVSGRRRRVVAVDDHR